VSDRFLSGYGKKELMEEYETYEDFLHIHFFAFSVMLIKW